MIRHNLPGFLAGPMPVPGWPRDVRQQAWDRGLQNLAFLVGNEVLIRTMTKLVKRITSQKFYHMDPKKFIPVVQWSRLYGGAGMIIKKKKRRSKMTVSPYIDWHNKLVNGMIS